MKYLSLLILVLSLFSGSAFSQQKDSVKSVFTGHLNEDSRLALKSYKNAFSPALLNAEERKSPLLAGVFSAILPGAGELYSKNYWKAAAFMAIEATAIYAGIYYNKKGDDATVEFKDYANTHWSPVRYAEWLNQFGAQLTSNGSKPPTIPIKNDPNLQPWQQVNFEDIHAAEEAIGFSHKLEHFGYQQYYELIGKYDQYSHGWDYWDAVRSQGHETAEWLHNAPQQMIDYSAMFTRPDETFYKYSQRAVTVLLVNHLLSVIDAVWSVHNYNKDLSMNVNLQQTYIAGMAEYYPQLNLQYRF